MKKKNIFLFAGTRPECIKLAPLYKKLQSHKSLDSKWIQVNQHKDLCADVLSFFKIKPYKTIETQIDNTVKDDAEHLCQLAASILSEASKLLSQEKPDLIFIQGDTLTAQQLALAAYYHKIPLAHIEAGLRSHSLSNPFPEELSRRIISMIGDLHFTPTINASRNLEKEFSVFKKDDAQIHLSGNTVIDALSLGIQTLKEQPETVENLSKSWEKANTNHYNAINVKELPTDIVLITAHRRENQKQLHRQLSSAIFKLACNNPNFSFVFIHHKNPQVFKVFSQLEEEAKNSSLNNLHFSAAMPYPLFIKLLQASRLIITDSGGIQEEAAYLQKPVLVCRSKTERPEGIKAGIAQLVEESEASIINSGQKILDSLMLGNHPGTGHSEIYGDAHASERILEVILQLIRQPQQQYLLRDQ